MKVCENCEVEIGGKDGVDNLCPTCEEAETKRSRRNARRRANARARREAFRACGMVKVKGALGGTYWE